MPLDIQLRAAQPIDLAGDVLVVGVAQIGGKSPALPPSLHVIDTALGGALSKLATKEEFTGKRDQVAVARDARAHPAGEARPARSGRPSLDRGARGAHVRGQGGPHRQRREGQVARPRAAPTGLEGAPARGGRGSRARRLPLHQVPHGRPQAQGGARRASSWAPAACPSRARRRSSTSARRSPPPSTSRATCRTSRPTDPPRDASPPRRRPSPRSTAFEDRGLRLQGDPPPRHEAHRRRRARERARAALRAHLVRARRARRRSSSSSARASRSTAAASASSPRRAWAR